MPKHFIRQELRGFTDNVSRNSAFSELPLDFTVNHPGKQIRCFFLADIGDLAALAFYAFSFYNNDGLLLTFFSLSIKKMPKATIFLNDFNPIIKSDAEIKKKGQKETN